MIGSRGGLLHSLLLRRWSGAVLGASLLITAAGVFFMRDIRVYSDPLHILSPGDPARRDSEIIARQLGGSEVFELLLPPSDAPGLLSTALLVAKVSAIEGVVGPAGRPRRSDGGYQLLSFLLAPVGSAERGSIFAQAEAFATEAGWIGPGATGLSVRIARDSNDLVHGQRRGILFTIAALWLVMAIGFRSVGLGLLGLIPNVVPIVLIQGGMGLLGQPLSVASSMIGCVMLGLVADDTIHLLHAYRSARGIALRKMARAFRAVRRPIVITTTVLCVGFSATILGELHATREFGGLAAATLVIALFADLLLLPALLLSRGPRRFSATCYSAA